MIAALAGGEWSAARRGRNWPTGKILYPFYRRLGGPQGRSGRAENLVPTGIRSQTVRPVSQSLYRLGYRAHKHSQHSQQDIMHGGSQNMSAVTQPACQESESSITLQNNSPFLSTAVIDPLNTVSPSSTHDLFKAQA
jgi:hypothetical protein